MARPPVEEQKRGTRSKIEAMRRAFESTSDDERPSVNVIVQQVPAPAPVVPQLAPTPPELEPARRTWPPFLSKRGPVRTILASLAAIAASVLAILQACEALK